MAYTYERTFAPSEEVSAFAASKLGMSVELAIFSHYLDVTGAPRKPTADLGLVDFSDTGVQADYVKLLVERHAPHIDEKRLRADARTKDQLRVPDISTYGGRFVPPRLVAASAGTRIEDTNRHEYYEIKPNSDEGERDGIKKLDDIADSYVRYGLAQVYAAGLVYPPRVVDYIELRWSEAFEYLRLSFMHANRLRRADLDLQVVRHATKPGLILYAFRVRLALDEQRTQDELRALAAGVLFAAALCAAAGMLELVAALEGFALTESMLEALSQLAEGNPAPPPRFRVAPTPPIGPRVSLPPEVPTELPELELEPDLEEVLEEEHFKRWQAGIAAAVIGRGYALAGKKMDLFCDEDYFQNVILDTSQVQRFIAMTRVGVPLSMTITAASAYLQLAVPAFLSPSRLAQQIDQRLPNQMRLAIRQRIPQVLVGLAGLPALNDDVTIVSQVLMQTPAMAAFIDPSLMRSTRQRVDRPGGGLGRGRIALPPGVLSRWKGQDARIGAPTAQQTLDQLATALLAGSAPDARNRQYLTDALANVDLLRHALAASPGFTVGIGVHALYQRPAGPITEQNRFGVLRAINLSRLFVVNVRDGIGAPAKAFEKAQPSAVSQDPVNTTERFRYLRRIGLRGRR
jgi:hypothetical protein